MPGFAELVLILIVVLIIFGAGKLPAIATAMGKAIQKLRTDDQEDAADEEENQS